MPERIAKYLKRVANSLAAVTKAGAFTATVLLLAAQTGSAHARDFIRIVGSSTVFPFAARVAEELALKTDEPTPIVEQIGTGGGLKYFCQGLGVTQPFDFPDIAMASRRMRATEREACAENGVTDILEVAIGYDGITLVTGSQNLSDRLPLSAVYHALAHTIVTRPPSKAPVLRTRQPVTRWSEISPDLPDTDIRIFGPPDGSGTRDAFDEMAYLKGCEQFLMQQFGESVAQSRLPRLCGPLRQDQGFIPASENDNLIILKLKKNPEAFGVIPFSLAYQNKSEVTSLALNGVSPSSETIRSGEYPLSRKIYLYVKRAHMRALPAIEMYLTEFLEDNAAGPFGYLVDDGFVPLSPADRRAELAAVEAARQHIKTAIETIPLQ